MVQLDSKTISEINKVFLDSIKRAGLVFVPEDDAVMLMQLNKEKAGIMRRNDVSTRQIEKYGLINGVKSRHTVVNMIEDHRIRVGEWYRDSRGNYRILTIAIRRLNGEF